MSFTLMMQEIATLRFQRSVVPKNAMSCDINTIDAAVIKTTCFAIYARVWKKW